MYLPSWRQLPPLGHVVFFIKYAVHAESTKIMTLRVKPLYLFGVVWGAALHCWHSPPSHGVLLMRIVPVRKESWRIVNAFLLHMVNGILGCDTWAVGS